jgi:hypothetical protein
MANMPVMITVSAIATNCAAAHTCQRRQLSGRLSSPPRAVWRKASAASRH